MPIAWVSMMARNSLLSGSGASAATTLMDSNSGRPGLDAANDHVDGVRQRLEEILFPALLEKAQDPARQTEAGGEREAGGREQSASDQHRHREADGRRELPETIMNFWVDQSRPAWVRRVLSGTFFSFWRRASSSFSDPSTCSRRERWLLSTWRAAGSGFATDARRAFGLLLSRQQGIEKDPCQAADGGGGEKGQCERLHVHGALPQTSTTTSAASSAAASRFSSP